VKLIVIDLETAYDNEYSLRKMSMADYIHDERFHVTGFSYKVDDKPTRYVPDAKVDATLTALKPYIESRVMVAHNSHFDSGILGWHYGIYPKMDLCTLAMARATGHAVHAGGNSLAKLAEYYDLGTKAPIHPDMTQEETEARATGDVDITYKLFQILLPQFGLDELKAIDWTVKIWTQPTILADRQRLEDVIVNHDKVVAAALAKAGYEMEDMRSPGRFADALIKLGVDVPTKISPTTGDETWAFAKTDEGFVALLESEDEDVAALAEARLGSKSGGDADRAERLLRMSAFGTLPVFLNYASTHTLRWSGGDKCLVGDTRITVLRGGEVLDIMMPQLLITDLVWDGEDFVFHEGLLDQGIREVIRHDGVEATPDHQVYCENQKETVALCEAKNRGLSLEAGDNPRTMEASASPMPSSEGPLY
jgi:DNA polymerase